MILHEAHLRRHLSISAARSALLSIRFAISLAICLLIFAVASTRAFAQSSSSSSTGASDDVIRVRTDLVTTAAYVLDARGRRVLNLSARDFLLREDGRIVKVEYFAAGTERVALAFALDASRSARETIARQREIALALFSRFGASSRVAVLRFGETAEMAVPFTTNANEALQAFRFPALADNHTAIFDAAAYAARSFDVPGGDATERRIVILISDGLDTASKTKFPDVIKRARPLGVSFYVIHLPIFAPRDGRLVPRPASRGFRELAEQTGGRYFMVGDAKDALNPNAGYDLAPVFKAIEEDLQGQYVLGYYPKDEARDASFHRIEIGLTSRDNQGLRVRSLREGYTLKNSRQ
ncbi:MAG TPA: VWA domain-containing protein [Pyrinomonadaceae bacterium]|jgi:Ca-activated chloride channel family protein